MAREAEQRLNQEETQNLLIEYLLANSVRAEMCLPVLLMLGKHRRAMLELMVYIRDRKPTEHEIIQTAIQLHNLMIQTGELED